MTATSVHICLITPGHLSGNPRIVKEADALSAAGFEVTVVSARYTEWGDRADGEFEGRPWRSNRNVTFGPRAARTRYLWQTARRRLARIAFMALPDRISLAEAAIHPATGELKREAISIGADLYIAHYTAALPAAAAAARHHGSSYGFDAEDFHPGDLPDLPEHLFGKRLIRSIESRYLPGALHLTAASPGISEAYADLYGIRRPTVVLNVFSAPDFVTSVSEEKPQSPSVYWFSQTIGADRGLECAVKALKLARSRPHLYLRGNVSAEYKSSLQVLADSMGVAGHLHFLPPCPPCELEQRGRSFDLGYAGEIELSANRRVALANKLFSYLSSGLAVVMSDTAAHQGIAPELESCSGMFRAADAESLAQAMDDFLLDRSVLSAGRQQAEMLARSRFNWVCESRILVQAVQKALRVTPPT